MLVLYSSSLTFRFPSDRPDIFPLNPFADRSFVRNTLGVRIARNPFKDVRECIPVRIRTGGEGTTGCVGALMLVGCL